MLLDEQPVPALPVFGGFLRFEGREFPFADISKVSDQVHDLVVSQERVDTGWPFGSETNQEFEDLPGSVTAVHHDGQGLFAGLEDPLPVMRYHSLVVAAEGLPQELEVTASSADRDPGTEIMALRHRSAPVWGVQFLPESVGTPAGRRLLSNFLGALAPRP